MKVNKLSIVHYPLSIILLACAMSLQAQTYNNGVWYALYDNGEHTMNTQGDYSTTVFAPTAEQLNVTWRYEWIDLFGAFKKIDTQVLESANGGSTTNQVGILAENTDHNSKTDERFSVSRNINWIKFNREGYPTHKVILTHIDIPLARHILFDSEEYGATTASYDFGVVNIVDAKSYIVPLRSFLTAGDITVSSSEPDIFHVGNADSTTPLVYPVGANACASKNGKAAAASEGVLGDIANYAFAVCFTPKKAKEYAAVVTITDGTSTVKMTVTGIGYKAPQTEHTYSAMICEGENYPDDHFGTLSQAGHYEDTIRNVAGGDSVISLTLQVNPTYSFSETLSMRVGDARTWQERDLSQLPVGDTTLVAQYQTVFGCDSVYTLQLTVLPRPTTYGNDTVYTCSGESVEYAGKVYRRPTTDSVLLAEKNQYGGDSIVELVVRVYPNINLKEQKTIYVGDAQIWQGYDLSTMPVGDTALVARYQTVFGCDSVYTLQLTVMQRPTTYGRDTVHLCFGDTVTYADRMYYQSANDSLLLTEKNLLGGDSVILLAVIAHPVSLVSDEKTITEGDDVVWQGLDLSRLPVGDTTLVAQYQTAFGCDSTYVLYLTVEEKPISHEAIDQTIFESSNLQIFKLIKNGTLFIRRGDELFDITGRKVE